MKLSVSARLSPPQNELFRHKLEAVEVDSVSGNEEEPDIVYLCGLPASHLLDRYEPLAAPLFTQERYRRQPWYFVDVIRGQGQTAERRWAFNEKSSFSGWLAVLHGFQLERRSPAEVEWVKTGSHLASIEAVRKGDVDRAGIDSSILDLDPRLLDGLEVVTTWGPWPAPPVLASRQLDAAVVADLKHRFASTQGGEWILLGKDHLDPITAVERGASHE
jgi:ABC-type phosphate/phosphonate transport system substrate-binding protein